MSLKTTLITAAELADLPPDDVLVVDCRFDLADPAAGQRAYLAGHLPGAVYASLDEDLSDLSRTALGLGRHPLPLEHALARSLARWGWRPWQQVVSYDGAGGALAAARLWWLLRLCGIDPAAVLDGGLAAWQTEGRPLETGEAARRDAGAPVGPMRYNPARMHLTIDADDRARHTLLDARAAPRFRGEAEPLDRAAGHIPGAINRPFSENLGPDGHFKAPGQLREEFTALLGDGDAASVVHMCGSGVTACHNLLAMEHAGLAGSTLYAPSWSGWISDETRAVATGEE